MYSPQLRSYLLDPRTPPVTPNAKNEEWNDRTGMSGTINGLAAAWSLVGTQGHSRTYANKRNCVLYISSGGSGNNFVGYAKTQPSTPYTLTCEVAIQIWVQNASNESYAGIGFRNSSNGKMWVIGLYQDFVVSTDEYRRVKFYLFRYAAVNSLTSWVSGFVHCLRSVWLRVTNDGSNLIASWSPSGVEGTYETITTESYATALVTPDQFIFGVDAEHSGQIIRGEFGPFRIT